MTGRRLSAERIRTPVRIDEDEGDGEYDDDTGISLVMLWM